MYIFLLLYLLFKEVIAILILISLFGKAILKYYPILIKNIICLVLLLHVK